MYSYFSTFIPGTTPIVEKALKDAFPDLQILSQQDGLIAYKTSALPQDIKQLRFFNNSFLLLKSFHKLARNPLEEMIRQSLKDVTSRLWTERFINKKIRTFRIITSIENQMVHISPQKLELVEEYFTRSKFIKINRNKPQFELWFLVRDNHTAFSGIRLTYHTTYQKMLPPGQLHPELAHILTLLSQPTNQDTVLDPFAGYGAIPFERTYFKYKEIIAIEKDSTLAQELQIKVKTQNKKITVIQGNATNLSDIADRSIDKIITDPPWGEHDPTTNLPTLYEKFLQEADRVLNPQGSIVILTSQKELLEKLLSSQKQLTLQEKHAILVSGKKAAIYKITKTASILPA